MQAHLTRLTDYVAAHAERTPEAFAMVFGESRVNYRQLNGAMRLVARALLRVGVHRGDRVVIVASPGPEAIVVFLASACIGAVFVGIDPRQSFDEIEATIHDAKPQVLFGCAEFDGEDMREQLATIMFSCPNIEEFVVIGGEPHRYGVVFDDFLAEGRAVNELRVETANATLGPDDGVAIVYAPGPTGALKGATLSHRNFVEAYSRTVEVYAADPVRLINNYPICHMHHLGLAAHAVIAGGCQVLMETFQPRECLRLVARERITVWGQDVCMFQKLVADQAFATTNFTSLQQLWWTGGIAPPNLVAKLAALPGICSTRWDVTEACGPVTMTLPEADPAKFGARVGQPGRGVDLRVVDARARQVPRGEPGRIQIAGASVMTGYFNRREETRDVVDAHGWLTTNYVGALDDDNELSIIGLLDDVYIGGGYAIHPGEIERVLERHPSVLRAVVVGVSDPVLRQVGCAFVQPLAGEQIAGPVIEEYAAKRLADHAQLHQIWLRKSLPEDLLGAPDRRALKVEAKRILAEAAGTGVKRAAHRRFRALDDL